jgi:hypothetical protein
MDASNLLKMTLDLKLTGRFFKHLMTSDLTSDLYPICKLKIRQTRLALYRPSLKTKNKNSHQGEKA